MEESTRLNIFFLPDRKTRERAIELSKRVAGELPTEFILGENRIPHVSTFHGPFTPRKLEELKRVIGNFASEIKSFDIKVNGFTTDFTNPCYIWYKCEKEKQLIETAMKIAQLANPLREGYAPSSSVEFERTSDEEYNIKTFDYIFVGKKFSPHITITKLKSSGDSKKTLEILGKEYSTFRADKIVIGYLGDNGTVTGIIEEFPLAS